MAKLPHASLLVGLVLAGCHATITPGDAPAAGQCTTSLTPGTGLRLLTRAEYDRTVADLLGDTTAPASDFPREPMATGLDNQADLLQARAEGVAAYLVAAEALSVDAVTNRRDLLVPCHTDDAACGARFIATFGRRAFRRTLTDDEAGQLQALFQTTLTQADFPTAVEWTTQAVLQAPQFLYRDEAPLAHAPQTQARLSGTQLATRLSYFLWATTPDDALLTAAEAGALDTAEGLTRQAERLLADPRALDGLVRFFSLWLSFDAIATTEKSVAAYPDFSPALAASWRSSLELFVRDSLQRDGTLAGLLTSRALFTNQRMGMYGPPGTGAWVRTELTDGRRAGLLTQPAFLAYKALPDGSSPVRRGVFVLNSLLCQPPPPPPAVAITPPKPSTSTTTRERFQAHSADPGCHACHQYIDPPGFTFEHYDGLGQWRDTENGVPIDSSGGLIAAADPHLVQPVADVIALEQLLAGSRQVHDCLAQSLYRFALGRALRDADSCTLSQVGDRFMASGGDLKALLLAIVQTDAFRANLDPELSP